VRVPRWGLAGSSFATTTVFSQKHLSVGVEDGHPLAGLFGSEQLSRFGTATIDFTHGRLILGGPVPSGGSTIAIGLKRPRYAEVLATVRVMIDKHPVRMIVDTGATTAFLDAPVAARLGLRSVGKSATEGPPGCRARVTPISIDRWTAGHIRLPSVVGLSGPSLVRSGPLKALVGVIGTNAFTRFGEITFDYTHSRLVVGPEDAAR
jgi:hypothetical protein